MKHIFFFDIDNTLLDHRTLTIPASALEAIDRLKDDGHTVVVATEPWARREVLFHHGKPRMAALRLWPQV